MKRKRKGIAAWILTVVLCMGSMQAGAAVVSDVSAGISPDETGQTYFNAAGTEELQSPRLLADSSNLPAGCKNVIAQMPFTEGSNGEQLFLTLADNQNYRWNVNGAGAKNNVVHLDDVEGENCTFRLTHVENEWYGIKYIKEDGIDRYVDIDGKSTNDGAVLHIWEDSDSKLKGNEHRQFAFYDAGIDAAGNQMYYIQVRKSGLWLGLEKDTIAVHQKLVQTSAAKAKKWYITPCVVPKSGSEYSLWQNDKTGVYCEIFRENSMEAVNVLWKEASFEINGMLFNSFVLGNHSRWMLTYVPKYDAYMIESVDQGWYTMSGIEPTNNVWDVVHESGGDKRLNLWEKQSKDRNYNTSQLWRFIGTDSGKLLIQNARSGRYVRFKEDILQQSSTGENFEVSLISMNSKKNKSSFLPQGTSDSMDWMSHIPDAALLSSVNMPGSHDTGTAGIVQDLGILGIETLSLTQCQKYYYEEQLTVGLRSFDIRCDAKSDDAKAENVNIIHGSSVWTCFNRWGDVLTLEQILDTSGEFLDAHPSETIVMTIAKNDGSMKGLIHALADYMKNNPNLFWQKGTVPTMGEARGKIVLISRFSVDNLKEEGVDAAWFGPQLDDWDDHDYASKQGLLDISGDSGYRAYAQDAYNERSGSKEKYIEGAINDSSGGTIPGDAYIWNYTSSALGFPLGLTRDINPWLWKERDRLFEKGRLGMVMLNYADITLSRRIYETNYDAGFFTAGCTFPTSVQVMYGDPMSEAKLSGQSGDGTFIVDDADINLKPAVADAGKKEVTIRFIPNDSKMKPVTQKVKITEVLPRPVTITVPAQSYEYGEDVNLVYDVNEAQLADGDTADSLGISLTLPSSAKTGSGHIPAGQYNVVCKGNNPNYVYTFHRNKVTVTQKTVSVIWSDTTNIVKGQPDADTWEKQGANVRVIRIDGVLNGDRCSAAVTGGDEKEASWSGTGAAPAAYNATAALSGDDAGNYRITENSRTKKYYIRRPGAGDYCLPDSASVIYGQPLSEAVLNGASGDGEFIFYACDGNMDDIDNIDDVSAMDVVPGNVKTDGTTYTYGIWYRPHNASSRGAGSRIPVTVLPKPITVNVSDTARAYGEQFAAYTYDENAVKAQLEGSDTLAGLGLSFTAYDDNGQEVTDTTTVGIYSITGMAGNPDYDVTVKPGTLKITCRIAELAWAGYDNLTYTGSPVQVTASVSNLIGSDTCNVEVVNGQKTNAGSYTAVAVRLDNQNYQLAQGSNLVQAYQISKAVPQITWPDVSLVYGQSLAESSITGGSANTDGTFSFRDENVLPTVGESNTNTFSMTFYPTDTMNYETVTNNIKITVAPKPLAIQMLSREKIYGDALAAGDLPVYYKESELVGDDTLTIQPIVTDENDQSIDPSYANAGTYTITADQEELQQNNPNYAITVQEGSLTVQQRPVILKWSDVNNIVYGYVNGVKNPDQWQQVGANVTASVSNLAKQADGAYDECFVVVEGGNETEPSDQSASGGSKVTIYHAVAKSLTGSASKNYTFSEEEPTVPDEPLKNIDAYQNSRLQPYVIRMSEDCILPFAAVMTYGEPLTDVRMIGASGNGTFEVVDKNGESIDAAVKLNAGSYADTYKVKFTPAEQNKEAVISNGYITLLVQKAPITVTAQDTYKTYGDGKPDYKWNLTDGKLAAEDALEDLLTARSVLYEYDNEDSPTIVGETSGDEETSETGAYDIVLDEQKNMNYDLTFVGAKLTIGPKTLKIVWSDTSGIVYGYVDGQKNLQEWQQVGANISASAEGLVKGDHCNLTYSGGNRKNAGTYWAVVTGVDNANYRLPSFADAEEYMSTRMLQYTILKADPEAVFPKELFANKGDVLGGLPHDGSADVPGTFTFEAADTVLMESGTYKMVFTPDDTQNYNVAEAMVKVTVSEKSGDETGGEESNGGTDPEESNEETVPEESNGGTGPKENNRETSQKESSAGNGTGINGSDAKKAGSPDTSDNNMLALYSITALLSLALLLLMAFRKKKHLNGVGRSD